MRVTVIIVNYRSASLAIDALRALSREARRDMNAVVVDCGSSDDSATTLRDAACREGWTSWVSIMPLERNGGFAFGNNAAIRSLMMVPQYVVLLNPDTVLRRGAIDTLVRFMQSHPKAGIAGSRLEDPDGTPQCSAFRFPSIWGELDNGLRLGPVSRLLHRHVVAPPVRNRAHRTDWVSGACMIVRREVFEDVGLLDEGFFLYYEEVDFCRRARRKGWQTWYVPQSRVVHYVGQSSGVGRPARRLPAYWFESRQRYFRKHHGRLYAAVADLGWMLGFLLWRARRVIQRKPDVDPPRMLSDFLRHSSLVSSV
jgi:GT2 family glycosyltransferase